MKLTQYDPSVNRNIEQAKMNAITNTMAYGTGGGWDTLSGSLSAVYKEQEKEWLKNQNDKVIDAQNDYNRQINSLLYDEEKGITFTMQGKNAEKAQSLYEQEEEKIQRNIMQKYNLDTDYAMAAFTKQRNDAVTANLSMLDKYQRNERVEYANNQVNEISANTLSMIQRDPDMLGTLWDNALQTKRAIRAGLGMDDKAISELERKELNELAKETLATTLATENITQGLNAIRELRDRKADESLLKRYEKVFMDKKAEKTTKTQSADYLEKHPELLKLTAEEAYNQYKKDNPLTGGTYAETPCGRIGAQIGKELGWDPSWGFAIACHESAWGKSAPQNNFFGIKWDGEGEYQELPTWERDANGKAYQITDKFKVYHSPEESGSDYAKWIKSNCSEEEIKNVHSAGDAVRLMKKHGYFTDNEDAYKASVESIAPHYKDINSDITEEERAGIEEKEKNAFMAIYREKAQERKENIARLLDNMQRQAFDMEQAGVTPETIYSRMVEQGDIHPELKESGAYRSLVLSLKRSKDAAYRMASGTGGGGNGASEKILNHIKSRIGIDIFTHDDLDKYLGALEKQGVGVTPGQYINLRQEVEKARGGEGKYSIPISDTERDVCEFTGLSGAEVKKYFPYAKQKVMEKAFEMKSEKGRVPDVSERRKMWIEAYTQKIVGPHYGFFGTNVPEASAAQLTRLEIAKIETADDNAMDVTDKYGHHHYIPASEWEDIMNGEKSIYSYGGDYQYE